MKNQENDKYKKEHTRSKSEPADTLSNSSSTTTGDTKPPESSSVSPISPLNLSRKRSSNPVCDETKTSAKLDRGEGLCLS